MYVVTGATGNTGKVVAARLLDAGKQVRVIVRSRDKAAALARRGAEVVVADLYDERALRDAVSGAQGVYLMSPPDPKSNDFIAERKRLTGLLARVVVQAEVPHVVLLSSFAAQHADGTGPILTAHNAEQQLMAAGATATIVRAGSFLENWTSVLPVAKRDAVLPSFLPLDRPVWTIDTRDIGDVAAKALLDGPRVQGTNIIELSGPVPTSPNDIARCLTRIFGHEVKPVHVPLEQLVPQLTAFGVSPHFAGLMRELYAAQATGTRIDYENVGERVYGHYSLEESLRELTR